MSYQEVEIYGEGYNESVQDIPVVLFQKGDGLPGVIWPLPGKGLLPGGEKISAFAIGKDDFPEKLQYGNLEASDIPGGHTDRIKELKEILQTTQTWLDLKVGEQTQNQLNKGKLPGDMSDASRLKRDDYRIKATDIILQKCPWMNQRNSGEAGNKISVQKSRFHTELLKLMLIGIMTPTGIPSTIEAVFTAIGDIITQTQKQIINRDDWNLFYMYTWDRHAEEVEASFRTVRYKISSEMYEVVRNKSSSSYVQVEFNFTQAEFTLNEGFYKRNLEQIQEEIDRLGGESIRDPVDGEIPVDDD